MEININLNSIIELIPSDKVGKGTKEIIAQVIKQSSMQVVANLRTAEIIDSNLRRDLEELSKYNNEQRMEGSYFGDYNSNL